MPVTRQAIQRTPVCGRDCNEGACAGELSIGVPVAPSSSTTTITAATSPPDVDARRVANTPNTPTIMLTGILRKLLSTPTFYHEPGLPGIVDRPATRALSAGRRLAGACELRGRRELGRRSPVSLPGALRKKPRRTERKSSVRDCRNPPSPETPFAKTVCRFWRILIKRAGGAPRRVGFDAPGPVEKYPTGPLARRRELTPCAR